MKEAREAAEHEVNKYRNEKQAEFEKMKAEVLVDSGRKLIKNLRTSLTMRLKRRSRRSRKTTLATRIKLSICWFRRYWKSI